MKIKFTILLLFIALIINAQYYIPQSYIVGYDVDLWLPDTIHVAQGNSIKLFNDNVAYVPVEKKTRVTYRWISSVGNSTSTYFNFKSSSPGNYSIKCIAINYLGQKIDSVSSIIKVEEKKALGSLNFILIGNSLTYGGAQYMTPPINDSLDVTATFIGTQKIEPYKNEGRSGWTTAQFITVGSPFWIGGKLDFAAYLTNNSLDTPDVVRISLGINDCFALGNTDAMIANLITLVYALRKDLPNAKIIVSTLSTASNTYWGWLANYLEHSTYENYVLKVRELNRKIYTTFENYDENTTSDYCTLTVDRDAGYPKTGLRHNNALHPDAGGYVELINGFLNKLNHIY